jgi:hypothetical protein
VTGASLEDALAALGIPCVVEADNRLAVLRALPGSPSFADDALRLRIVALATEHGFSHVAVDLANISADEERPGAAVSGN